MVQRNPGSARYSLFVLCSMLILLMILYGTGAAFTSGKSTPGGITVILDKKDNHKEISVKCGTVIQIELKEIGSAGYRWHVQNQDTEHVSLLDERTKVPEEGKMGAPGLSIWRFRALEEGITEIKMAYYRDWEGPTKTAESFEIKLNIQK